MANEITQTVKIEASLTQIQSQLKTLEGNFRTSFANIGSLAQSALGAFGVGLGVGSVVAFGKSILDLADTFQNLHEQTGLSIELLSGIKSTLEESGSSVEAFGRGVFNLQKNLGNIDKATDPAAQAIRHLKLNVDDLRNSSPDEFVRKITDALAGIENPVERNTLLFNLLGKQAKELGPAFAQLAGRFNEFKQSGLTAAEIKALDDVGDALTRLKNQALLLGAEGVAGILRFFGALRDAPKVAAEIDAATTRAASLFNLPKERVEGMSSLEIIRQAEIPTRQAPNPIARRMARDDLLNAREELEKLNRTASQPIKPPAVFRAISDGAKTAKSDVDNFLDGLQKQLATLENKKIELTFGPNVALQKNLDQQFEAFKENLRQKNLPIPKGLEEFFTTLRDRIVGSNQALTELNQSLEETVARQQALADEANEGVGIKFLNKEDVQRDFQKLQQLKEQFKELQKALAIEILPVEQRPAAQAIQEFEDRVRAINEWRDAAVAAGQDVARVNQEAAEATANAWAAASSKMKAETDEANEFVRRAFERGFDAVSDAFRDLLDGNITSLEDFGEKVRKTLNSLVADFLTLTAKEALLGKDFGKQGAGIGGIVGDLFGLSKPAPAAPSAGPTAAEVLDMERGQELLAAAEAGLQATGVMAETGIQTLSAQAQASLQTSAALAETGIQTTGATAQAGIQAVEAAAIAAIQAASAGGSAAEGAGGFMGVLGQLFGSSGGAMDAGAVSEGGGLLALGHHEGGLITPGGAFATFKRPIELHGGGEVPVIAQSGEFMMRRWSADRLGQVNLNYMNAYGQMPPETARKAGSTGGDNNTFVFNGVQDMDSFRRSRAQLTADLSRAVRRGNKHL